MGDENATLFTRLRVAMSVMAYRINIHRLTEMVQGQPGLPSPTEPAWILGQCFAQHEPTTPATTSTETQGGAANEALDQAGPGAPADGPSPAALPRRPEEKSDARGSESGWGDWLLTSTWSRWAWGDAEERADGTAAAPPHPAAIAIDSGRLHGVAHDAASPEEEAVAPAGEDGDGHVPPRSASLERFVDSRSAIHRSMYERRRLAGAASAREETQRAAEEADLQRRVAGTLQTRIWMTYRTGMEPLAPSGLTSDAGWGCTIRSGQMLLAQALVSHWHGTGPGEDVPVRVASAFFDSVQGDCPLSIHHIIAAGRRHAVHAGQWLGPYQLCLALEDAVNRAEEQLGLRALMVKGGGQPVVFRGDVEDFAKRGVADQGWCEDEEAMTGADGVVGAGREGSIAQASCDGVGAEMAAGSGTSGMGGEQEGHGMAEEGAAGAERDVEGGDGEGGSSGPGTAHEEGGQTADEGLTRREEGSAGTETCAAVETQAPEVCGGELGLPELEVRSNGGLDLAEMANGEGGQGGASGEGGDGEAVATTGDQGSASGQPGGGADVGCGGSDSQAVPGDDAASTREAPGDKGGAGEAAGEEGSGSPGWVNPRVAVPDGETPIEGAEGFGGNARPSDAWPPSPGTSWAGMEGSEFGDRGEALSPGRGGTAEELGARGVGSSEGVGGEECWEAVSGEEAEAESGAKAGGGEGEQWGGGAGCGTGRGAAGHGVGRGRADGVAGVGGRSGDWHPLVLLVPVMLGGHGTVNPLYYPQIKRLLRMPQSVGIVGGRPRSSLFFVGYQGDSLFYLDPHDVQPVQHPRQGGFPSYQCSVVRHMPIAGLDPSMAFGFYLGKPSDLDRLEAELAEAQRDCEGAPLVTLAQGRMPVVAEDDDLSEAGVESSRRVGVDDWELV